MAEFESVYSYDKFAWSVARRWRYFQRDHEAFLAAVRDTASSRVEVIARCALLWRAQKGCDWRDQDIGGGETVGLACAMGRVRMKPFADKSKQGRANPRGIPCLYTATHRETAIAEVRPWIGSYVTVAQFEVLKELRVVNCTTDDRSYKVYFTEPDAKERERMNWVAIDRAFARPIEEDEFFATYEATQILAEMFRSEGYDGIGYRSSLGPGHNIALFDLDAAEQANALLMKVDKFSIEASEEGDGYTVKDRRRCHDEK